MPGRRFVSVRDLEGPSIEVWLSERAIEGNWFSPNVPVLIFSSSKLPGSSVTPHGGPVATGTPIQLLFWGSWWTSGAGGQRLWLIEDGVKRILSSPYTSELAQYGISPPHFRGSLIVTKPTPPSAFGSEKDESKVSDMITDLIEDDVFPDPDDEQIGYFVFMPKGFAKPSFANGAHSQDYDYEFPFDFDWFWWAWIRYFDDSELEDTTRTFSHELAELLSDPTGNDGWYSNEAKDGEIADAAVDGKGKQTAWVNGAKVQAYWSNRHRATVIPIDHDYRARIIGSVALSRGGTHELDQGTFRPDPADMAFCRSVPACCYEDRDYTWVVNGRNETANLRVETRRYRQPIVEWSINGQTVKGSGLLKFDADTSRYNGRNLVTARESVSVAYRVSSSGLETKTLGVDRNFDVPISCTVRDGSINGDLKTDVVAVPKAVVGFVGSELVLDPIYVQARDACHKGIADLFSGAAKKAKSRKPRPGEEVEINPGVLVDVPAWARVEAFARARQAVELAELARAELPRAEARKFIKSLVATTPALTAALSARTRRSKR